MGIKYRISKRILDAATYHAPEHREGQLNLDLNESAGFLSQDILSELKNFDKNTLSTYPEYGELNEALAQYAGCQATEVLVTNGSDQAIEIILRLFFQENDEVVAPAPTFFVYFSILNFIGAKLVPILYHDEKDHFVFPFQKTFEALTSKSAGLLLCQPSNPLGSLIPAQELIQLLNRSLDLEIPVIIDEAYFEFAGVTSVQLLKQYPNLVIIRTLSKSFGLAGIRLGYLIANQEIISAARKLRLPWAVNHFAVHAGLAVLRHQAHFKSQISQTLQIKSQLQEATVRAGIQTYSTATNFLVLKSPNHTDLLAKFARHNIRINDISHYPYSGELVAKALRLSMPRETELKQIVALLDVN